ncbi:hypothetical protein AB0M02_39035 [Actinoplanes sp. NPDC051861]|uniref:hypothetical protein n=1 Tax=Actinoplanes sp. NPDC051861 TaxID=3155170 RepID=UPI0034177983
MIRRAAPALLLFALLAGCSSAASPVADVVSTAPFTRAAGIPASALLQPDDVYGADGESLPKGDFAFVRPLRPCDEAYPSDSTRVEAVAKKWVVDTGEGGGTVPTVVTEFLGLHEPGGAEKQFGEIVAALEKCASKGERKWTVLTASPESVLVRIDTKESYADEAPSTVSRYAAMARVDDAIVVVTDLGWENLGGDEKLVKELIAKAVQRAVTIP